MDSYNSSPSSPLSSMSSPLSSIGSRSPSPPEDYPTPPESNISERGLESNMVDASTGDSARDGPPPAKKRKIAGPKERKTEYLNLQTFGNHSCPTYLQNQEQNLHELVQALRKKRKIVVIAGAGISVSAGIPDFRSSTGLFSTLKSQHKLKHSGKDLFDASVYKNDSSTTSFHSMVRELSHQTQNAKPTPFHHMLASLAEEGRLLRLYSQNVDGIDTSLEPLATTVPLNGKGPWPKTIQLHGGLEKMVCTKCSTLSNFNGQLFEGPEPPPCSECETHDSVRRASGLRSHGIGRLRPRMVLYNEFNPDEEAIGAVSASDLRSRPDAVIVVGTSLKVPGIRRLARELCAVTRSRRGGFTAWINQDPEPVGVEFRDSWDLVVRGKSDEVARHVGLPHWDDKDSEEFKHVTPNKYKFTNSIDSSSVSVVVESKSLTGIMTPGATPRRQSPSVTESGIKRKLKQPELSFGTSKVINSEKPQDLKRLENAILPLSTASIQLVDSIVPKPKLKKPAPGKKPTKKSAIRPIDSTASKITDTFHASKATKPTKTTRAFKSPFNKSSKGSSEAAVVIMGPKQSASSLFPNLSSSRQLPQDPMRPLSPVDLRTNMDTPTKHNTKPHRPEQLQLGSFELIETTQPPIPCTPTRCRSGTELGASSPIYDRQATISPKGPIPTGMANLLL